MKNMKDNCAEKLKYSKIFIEGHNKNWVQSFLRNYESDLEFRLDSVLGFKRGYEKSYNTIKNTCGLQEAKLYEKAKNLFDKQKGKYIPQDKGTLQIGKPPDKLKIDKSKALGKKIKDEGKGKLQIGKPPAKYNIDKSKALGNVIKVSSVKDGILTTKQYGEIEDISGEAIYNNLKSGASPIFFPWNSTIHSILMTYAYILKNNSNDCSVPQQTLIKYERMPTTTKTTTNNPNRLILENVEETAKSIIRCWLRKKVVAIPLHVSQSGSGRDSHHSNMLLFNTWRMEAEHYEPHGEVFHGAVNQKTGKLKKLQGINLSTGIKAINKEIEAQLKKNQNPKNAFERERLNELDRKIVRGFKYLPPDETCPADFKGYKGFQARDRVSGGDRNYEGVVITEIGGYCTMYTLFYLDLRLKTLRTPAKDIVRIILGLFKRDYDLDADKLAIEDYNKFLKDGGTEEEYKSQRGLSIRDELDKIFKDKGKLRDSFLELMRGMAKFSFEAQLKMVDEGLITRQELIQVLGKNRGMMGSYKYEDAVRKYLINDWAKFTT